jgi:hypothetical protein
MAIVAKYSLNWNSNDSAGTNNGSNSNITYVDWKLNQAASFNGSSSVISIASNLWNTWWVTSINTIVKVATNPWNWVVYSTVSQQNSTTHVQYNILYYNVWWTYLLDFWRVKANIWNQWVNITSATPILQVWVYYYLSLTYDWALVKWYINWIFQWQISASWNWTFWYTNATTIWRLAHTWAFYFNWLIDEVEIHNSVLSPAEVKNKYLEAFGFFTYW